MNRLLTAAQLFRHLVTFCHQNKPETEGQLRPMIGLSPEQARLAWECAVQAAGGCKVTQRLVKLAMSELGFGGPKKLAPQGPTGAERRQALKDGMSELLILLSRRAPYDALIEKAEA